MTIWLGSWCIILACAGWVWLDTRKHRIGRLENHKGLTNMSPAGWFYAVALLWIVAFPLYLVRRRSLMDGAAVQPIDTPFRASQAAGVPFLLLAMASSWPSAPRLPECHDAQVQQLLRQIAAKSANVKALRDFAQEGAEQDKRLCKVVLDTQVDSGIVHYQVNWQKPGGPQFVVQVVRVEVTKAAAR